MPRKMSGIAMIVIDPSSVASRTASVAFERAIHLYRSSPVLVTTSKCTGSLFRQPVHQAATLPAMTVGTAPLAQEFRETLGRLVRRLRAESGQPATGQMAVLGR